jgi:hypothetical protein
MAPALTFDDYGSTRIRPERESVPNPDEIRRIIVTGK